MDLALVFPGCHRRGGVERSVWELARHWSGSHAVTVYASEVDRDGLPADVRVVPVRPRATLGPLRPWAFANASRDALRGSRHDHVISFGVGAATGAADVLWVNSVHRAWLEQPGEGWRQHPARRVLPHHQSLLALERRHYRPDGLSGVVVVADAVANDLERLYSVPRSLAVTVHNGFDPDEFDARRRDERDESRREIGIPVDAKVLLMVANELPRKGWPTLLEATARLDDPSIHVMLAGKTSPEAYRSLAEGLGLAHRVHFIGSRADVGRVHAAADLFVLPTTYEAFCLSIVEALASGLPVITTDVPGAGDLIEPGRNGLLQNRPRDPDELAQLIGAGLETPLLSSMTACARDSVTELTWDRLASLAAGYLETMPRRAQVAVRDRR